MNENTTAALTAALRPWVVEAMALIRQRPDILAELTHCLDHGEVRVCFHVRANSFTVEAIDYEASTVAELFCQTLVPPDAGFALPDNPAVQ